MKLSGRFIENFLCSRLVIWIKCDHDSESFDTIKFLTGVSGYYHTHP